MLTVRHKMNLLQDTDTECVEERADNNPEPELTLETCDSWSVSTLSLVATPSSSCLIGVRNCFVAQVMSEWRDAFKVFC